MKGFLMRKGILMALAVGLAPTAAVPAQSTGFLDFPLKCGDKNCAFEYFDNPYRSGAMNSVLDHSMKKNANNFWEFGKVSNKGGDGIVIAFNGEKANGKASSDETCIGGTLLLKPGPGYSVSTAMVNGSGCGSKYASYDEHPGYDYKASGVPVRAAAAGTIVNISGARCYIGNTGKSCDDYGLLGLEHSNGYITQYGHMKEITAKKAGVTVKAGEQLGIASNKGTIGAHLHFEVYKRVGKSYYLVDPYGWTGSGKDPLYSAGDVKPAKLWKY